MSGRSPPPAVHQTGKRLSPHGEDGAAIARTLAGLNGGWTELAARCADRGLKLRQAAQQQLFNKALDDAEAKLAEMERSLAADDIGTDLRGVRDLLKKHQVRGGDQHGGGGEGEEVGSGEWGAKLAADDIGTDLGGVRDLLKKHQVRGAG